MKYYDKEQLEKLHKNSAYGYRVLLNGYGKVFAYCAKIFRDNDCELISIYVDTDIMSFIFKKKGLYNSSNFSIKNYNEFLDSAEKYDFASSAGLKLKVIAKRAYAWEVKL